MTFSQKICGDRFAARGPDLLWIRGWVDRASRPARVLHQRTSPRPRRRVVLDRPVRDPLGTTQLADCVNWRLTAVTPRGREIADRLRAEREAAQLLREFDA